MHQGVSLPVVWLSVLALSGCLTSFTILVLHRMPPSLTSLPFFTEGHVEVAIHKAPALLQPSAVVHHDKLQSLSSHESTGRVGSLRRRDQHTRLQEQQAQHVKQTDGGQHNAPWSSSQVQKPASVVTETPGSSPEPRAGPNRRYTLRGGPEGKKKPSAPPLAADSRRRGSGQQSGGSVRRSHEDKRTGDRGRQPRFFGSASSGGSSSSTSRGSRGDRRKGGKDKPKSSLSGKKRAAATSSARGSAAAPSARRVRKQRSTSSASSGVDRSGSTGSGSADGPEIKGAQATATATQPELAVGAAVDKRSHPAPSVVVHPTRHPLTLEAFSGCDRVLEAASIHCVPLQGGRRRMCGRLDERKSKLFVDLCGGPGSGTSIAPARKQARGTSRRSSKACPTVALKMLAYSHAFASSNTELRATLAMSSLDNPYTVLPSTDEDAHSKKRKKMKKEGEKEEEREFDALVPHFATVEHILHNCRGPPPHLIEAIQNSEVSHFKSTARREEIQCWWSRDCSSRTVTLRHRRRGEVFTAPGSLVSMATRLEPYTMHRIEDLQTLAGDAGVLRALLFQSMFAISVAETSILLKYFDWKFEHLFWHVLPAEKRKRSKSKTQGAGADEENTREKPEWWVYHLEDTEFWLDRSTFKGAQTRIIDLGMSQDFFHGVARGEEWTWDRPFRAQRASAHRLFNVRKMQTEIKKYRESAWTVVITPEEHAKRAGHVRKRADTELPVLQGISDTRFIAEWQNLEKALSLQPSLKEVLKSSRIFAPYRRRPSTEELRGAHIRRYGYRKVQHVRDFLSYTVHANPDVMGLLAETEPAPRG